MQIYDPIVEDVSEEQRQQVQEDFGRHVVEQRNRMAAAVRRWIETDATFPIPVYDRLLARIRDMDASERADVASVALLMADQMISAVLGTFDGGEEFVSGAACVNYAVVAQRRKTGSDEVLSQVDVNRGEPVVAIWKAYSRWLSRFAPSDLRARGGSGRDDPS